MPLLCIATELIAPIWSDKYNVNYDILAGWGLFLMSQIFFYYSRIN